MAEHGQQLHDGRFGDGFDDEIDVGGLGKIAIGLIVTCVVAIVIVWLMLRGGSDAAETAADAPAAEHAIPAGPRLQTAPEHEYRQMRRELDRHVEGYGWVDEGTGVVHIPVDRAIDLLLEQGVDGRAKEIIEDAPAEGSGE